MLTTLSNGRTGIRSAIHVDIIDPRKDELLRVPDPNPSPINKPNGPPGLERAKPGLESPRPEIPADSRIATPEAQPVLDFIASDESLDRYDEIVCASGWRLDTYRRNPVFQNAHQYGDIMFTLGKALITEVRPAACGLTQLGTQNSLRLGHSTLEAKPSSVLYQRIQFATDVNPIARIAYGLYKGKFLNAVSVGFIPVRWLDANGVEHTCRLGSCSDSALRDFGREARQAPMRLATEDGQGVQRSAHDSQGVANFRRKYLEQELLEVSAVGIPANPNALALGLKSGAIEKTDLREMLALLKSVCAPQIQPRRDELPRVPIQRDRSGPVLSFNPQPFHLQPPATAELLSLARELQRILRHA